MQSAKLAPPFPVSEGAAFNCSSPDSSELSSTAENFEFLHLLGEKKEHIVLYFACFWLEGQPWQVLTNQQQFGTRIEMTTGGMVLVTRFMVEDIMTSKMLANNNANKTMEIDRSV